MVFEPYMVLKGGKEKLWWAHHAHKNRVEAIVESGVRYDKWNQSIAIGTQKFVENTKQKLGQIRAPPLAWTAASLNIEET